MGLPKEMSSKETEASMLHVPGQVLGSKDINEKQNSCTHGVHLAAATDKKTWLFPYRERLLTKLGFF